MRKAVSPPLHPFLQAPLEIVRFGHVMLLTGRWILRLFKTPGCADLIGITPFNKKTYPSHHSNTLSNTKIFIDQTLFFPHLQLRTLNSSKRKDRTPRVRFHLSVRNVSRGSDSPPGCYGEGVMMVRLRETALLRKGPAV